MVLSQQEIEKWWQWCNFLFFELSTFQKLDVEKYIYKKMLYQVFLFIFVSGKKKNKKAHWGRKECKFI